MKRIVLLVIPLFFPIVFYAQLLSGLWMGSVSNDSTRLRKDELFEIALAEYKGKVYGYSRSTFTVNDNLYYIVKRVKGDIQGDVCEVKDDYVVSHNFPNKPEKGVKVISTFIRNKVDSTWNLEGDLKTTKAKRYYSISGKAGMKEEKDMSKSKLFSHLEELKLDKDLPVFADAKKNEVLLLAKTNIRPQLQKGINSTVATVDAPNTTVKTNTVAVSNEIITIPEKTTTITLPETQQSINKETAKTPDAKIKETKSVAVNSKIAQAPEKPKPVIPVASKPKPIEPIVKEEKAIAINKPADKPIEKSVETVIAKTNNVTTATNNNVAIISSKPDIKSMLNAAAHVEDRAMTKPELVTFASDSLVLVLYDNGEVDGDTVSVLMNGELIIAKQMLRTTADKRTIYTNGTDEITLILYAENLGKYPPNTGLLMVYDGDERYQVRFSADLQKNASIILRRKK